MQAKKYEFCITAVYKEYYDVWACTEDEARENFMRYSSRYLPDDVKCLIKDRENAEIVNCA